MKRAKVVGIIAIIITVLIVGNIVLQIEDWSRDWTTNTADLAATELSASPDDVTSHIQSWAETKPRWTVESVDKDGEKVTLHLTRRTLIMRYVDDVKIEIQQSDAGSVLTANSTSRLGKGDLGQNPRNLRELQRALELVSRREVE